MSVAKLQVSLVRLVRFTMLELLPLQLYAYLWIYEHSQGQISLARPDRDPPTLRAYSCMHNNLYYLIGSG